MEEKQLCRNCGAVIGETARYCSTCGTEFLQGPRASIPTWEQEGGSYPHVELAGFWRRAGAYVIDIVIVWSAILGLQLLTWVLPRSLAGPIDLLFPLLFLTILLGYFPYFWANSGQTPGKRLLGLKVVSTAGNKLSMGRAWVRLVGYWVSSLPLAPGYIWVALDRRKQGWHDKIAGTQVVKLRDLEGNELSLGRTGEQPIREARNRGVAFRLIAGLVIVSPLIILITWMASGFYHVGPDEQAARRLFGVVLPPATQRGLNWWWPSPVGKTNKENIGQSRRSLVPKPSPYRDT